MMKKSILLAVMMVALSAVANDRLYIEDFSIEIGETKQVSIILENTAQYTAFQTDIYLPEGLTVEKEDDEYAFELTSRKSRDHIIMGEDRPDGAIRVMSYSMQVNPFSGNSGALVTFSITATNDFTGDAVIELKHTLFTDMNDQEISFANESCQVQLQLKDLTGEIVFENVGEKTIAWCGGVIEIYDGLSIGYSGSEEVEFTIFVTFSAPLDGEADWECYHSRDINGYNLLTDDVVSNYVDWDSINNLYTVYYLEGLSEDLSNIEGIYNPTYSARFLFQVTVHAKGYQDLQDSYYAFTGILPDDGSPYISEYAITDLTYFYRISFSHVHNDLGDGPGSQIGSGDYVTDYYEPVFAVDRLSYDYEITISAHERPMIGGLSSYSEVTLLVPARECSLAISQYDNIIPGQNYFIIDNGSRFQTDENELGSDFAIIESSGWSNHDIYYDYYVSDLNFSIIIDNQCIFNEFFTNEETAAVNLLPFGDIYGGEHHIEVIGFDIFSNSYNSSLSVDTIIEYHPLSTRLSPDSFILDVEPNMCNAMLCINGEEVELSTDGENMCYALERMNNDYSVTVQVGDKITNDLGEEYSAWSQETTVVVPAKSRPGDVNGDGTVNVSDVTALISKILGNDVEPFYPANAELTGDENLNVADVTALIRMILNS